MRMRLDVLHEPRYPSTDTPSHPSPSIEDHLPHNILRNIDREFAHARSPKFLHNPSPLTVIASLFRLSPDTISHGLAHPIRQRLCDRVHRWCRSLSGAIGLEDRE